MYIIEYICLIIYAIIVLIYTNGEVVMNLVNIFKKETTKKLLTLAFIALVLYLMRGILDLFLLTFMFAYIIYSIELPITNFLNKFIRVKRSVVILFLYIVLFVLIAVFIYEYVPVLVKEITNLIDQLSKFSMPSSNNKIVEMVTSQIHIEDVTKYLQSKTSNIVALAANVGKWSLNIFLAMMLSLIFMMEIDSIKNFMRKFKTSKIAGAYNYLRYFAMNFLNTFGKVIQAQLTIAVVNTVLSMIALSIMGFPSILAIGLMVFVLSLIPVAGVIISLIPLTMIAFKIGGLMKVLYVLIMIALLHMLESYVLNPKLMSVKTKLPVFVTFAVLLVSQHFMGIWGLLLGIPLFMFILDLLDVKLVEPEKPGKLKIQETQEIQETNPEDHD